MHLVLFSLFFQTSSLNQCQVANCESCSVRSNSVCINCDKGFIRDELKGCLSDGGFKDFQIENCESYSDSRIDCKVCRIGYVLLNGRCEPECDDDCICFNPFLCSKGASLKQDVEGMRGGPQGTKENEGRDPGKKKVEDREGSPNDGCGYGCASCDTKGICEKCNDNFSMIDGFCYKRCDSGCTDCVFDYCLACEDGYFLRYDQCMRCMDHCELCTTEFSCSQCSSGYDYKDDQCRKSSKKEQETSIRTLKPLKTSSYAPVSLGACHNKCSYLLYQRDQYYACYNQCRMDCINRCSFYSNYNYYNNCVNNCRNIKPIELSSSTTIQLNSCTDTCYYSSFFYGVDYNCCLANCRNSLIKATDVNNLSVACRYDYESICASSVSDRNIISYDSSESLYNKCSLCEQDFKTKSFNNIGFRDCVTSKYKFELSKAIKHRSNAKKVTLNSEIYEFDVIENCYKALEVKVEDIDQKLCSRIIRAVLAEESSRKGQGYWIIGLVILGFTYFACKFLKTVFLRMDSSLDYRLI